MSYNMPKMLSSKYQTCSFKIEDLKINPISTNEGSENLKHITRNVL